MTKKNFYTVNDVAKALGVHRTTVRRWLAAGKIAEPDRDRNGWRIFSEKELEEIRRYAEQVTPNSASRQFHFSLSPKR